MAELPSPTHIHTLPWLQELFFTSDGECQGISGQNKKIFWWKWDRAFLSPFIQQFFPSIHNHVSGWNSNSYPGIVSKYFCTSTLLDSLVAAHWAVLTHYSVYNSSFFRISILCSQNVSVTKSDQNFKEKDRMYLPASNLVLYCKGWSFVVQCASACPCLSNALLVLAKVGPCPSLSERTDAIWMESSLCGPSVCSGVRSGSPSQPGSQGKLLVNMSTTTTTLSHIQ